MDNITATHHEAHGFLYLTIDFSLCPQMSASLCHVLFLLSHFLPWRDEFISYAPTTGNFGCAEVEDQVSLDKEDSMLIFLQEKKKMMLRF